MRLILYILSAEFLAFDTLIPSLAVELKAQGDVALAGPYEEENFTSGGMELFQCVTGSSIASRDRVASHRCAEAAEHTGDQGQRLELQPFPKSMNYS